MTLFIPVTEDYDEYFIYWLLEVLRDNIRCQASNPHLTVLNKELQENHMFSSETIIIDFHKVVMLAGNSLKVVKIRDRWKIFINPIINYGKTAIKLVALCKLVNNGFLGCRGTNIFDNIFNNVSANVSKYYTMYTMEI